MKQESNETWLAGTIGRNLAKLAAKAGRSREAHLLQMLMDHIPDAIYFKDVNSRFICISRAHAHLFRLKNPADAIGKTDADFFASAHARQALEDEQQVLLTGKPLVGIEEMETWPDGSVTWVSTTKMPLLDDEGKIVGTFGISRDITKRKLAEQALAERTRQLQQQKQQMEEELKMARELQLAMLPQTFPRMLRGGSESSVEFFSFYFPCGAVSGDFFDVLELSDTKVGVFICDVMGHDVRAALITAMVRAIVQDLGTVAADPGQLLSQINRGLSAVFKQTGTTMYATAFYLVADLARGEMLYSSAAHPAPLHLHRSTGTVERLVPPQRTPKGPALGLFKEATYPTISRPLNVGDLVALYTDGLSEAESPLHETFGEAGLLQATRRHVNLPGGQLLGELISEIQTFTGHEDFHDDVCLVGMEVKRLGNGS